MLSRRLALLAVSGFLLHTLIMTTMTRDGWDSRIVQARGLSLSRLTDSKPPDGPTCKALDILRLSARSGLGQRGPRVRIKDGRYNPSNRLPRLPPSER